MLQLKTSLAHAQLDLFGCVCVPSGFACSGALLISMETHYSCSSCIGQLSL